MLERVPLLEKELADYEEVAGVEAIERIRALAEPFRGARVLHINATAYGGGVAELLSTHVPLLRSLGIEAEWQVIHGSDEFFAVTKAVHNALAGCADVPWDRAHAEGVPREGARERAAARGRVGLRHRARPAARGAAHLHRRTRASTGPRRSGSGAATSTSPTRATTSGSSSARTSSATTRPSGRWTSSSPSRCRWTTSSPRRRASTRSR